MDYITIAKPIAEQGGADILEVAMRGMKWIAGTAGAAVSAACMMAAAAEADRADRSAVIEGHNDFAFDLYARLQKDPGNLIVSPYSVSTALAMTFAGARGNTAAEMAKALHLHVSPERLHPAWRALQAELKERAGEAPGETDPAKAQTFHPWTLASALWGNRTDPFLQSFLDLTRRHYQAELAPLDFEKAPEDARQAINRWVEKKTRGRIWDLIPQGGIDRDVSLILTNVLYFKMAWFHPFEARLTRDEPFHVSRDKVIDVPTMHQTLRVHYMDNRGLRAVEVPYDGRSMSMVLLVPSAVDGLAGLERSLSRENLSLWLRSMTKQNVSLALPKFNVVSRFDLKETLAAMGMKDAFDVRTADFSAMTDKQKLYISRVLHQAFIDTDERGTEAGAATAMVMAKEGLPTVVSLRVDRPFIYIIRDVDTGILLFMGRVTELPAAGGKRSNRGPIDELRKGEHPPSKK
jgi:serpin B